MKTEQYRGFTLNNRSGRYDDWFVSHLGHTRWGTLAEVKNDVDIAVVSGYLPTSKYLFA